MKKVILFTILLFAFSIVTAQSVPKKQYNKKSNYEENKTAFLDYTDWNLTNDGCWGCASFYWKVIKTANPDPYGYYFFYIYFYSNSYYKNGKWASTYVWNIYLNVDNYKFNTEPVWITFKETYTPNLLWFKTKNPKPYISFTWGGKKII